MASPFGMCHYAGFWIRVRNSSSIVVYSFAIEIVPEKWPYVGYVLCKHVITQLLEFSLVKGSES